MMPIELASGDIRHKQWGSNELRPWSVTQTLGDPVGEIWFSRSDAFADESTLLVKLLFTRAPLSLQVHPGDDFARSIGLPRGKSEAWYVLGASPGSKVAIGLTAKLEPAELRARIADGTIAELAAWKTVSEGEAMFVPAGCIHAIGAGLVLAEVQQRSDTTYRLFDYGRSRDLHVEEAIATASAGPAPRQAPPIVLSKTRTLLGACPHFALERLTFAADSDWWLNTGLETWIVVLSGQLRVGTVAAGIGETIALDEDHARIEVGPAGAVALIAYAKPEALPNLLEKPGRAFQPRDAFVPVRRGTNGAPPSISEVLL